MAMTMVMSLPVLVTVRLALDGTTAVDAAGISRSYCRQMPGFALPTSNSRRRCAQYNEAAIYSTCTESVPNTQIRNTRETIHSLSLRAPKNGESDDKGVDDYVLNVHGGKYRFDDPSSVGTAIGRDFAESLYSSSSSSSTEEEAAAAAYDVWPNWAKRMASIKSLPGSVQDLKVPVSGEIASVKIQNEYKTWEPYYATIIQLTEDHCFEGESAPPPFEVVGKVHGTLAPQGGASNLCDENDPYYDFKFVSVRFVDGGNIIPIEETWCLAAGTEEEQWYYRLVLEKS
jgi:hypothetical protein